MTGERQNDQWLLKIIIEDSGIGIVKENIDKLFGKFERFDLHKNRNIEGTGLGLNIVKSYVDLMNGMISVKSEYGQGSAFTVCIPQKIVNPAPVGMIDISSTAADASSHKHECNFIAPQARILVVDDVLVNLNVFVNLIKVQKLSALFPDVDQRMAIRYSGESEELYIEFLKDFTHDGRYERLSEIYDNADTKKYVIEIHTL